MAVSKKIKDQFKKAFHIYLCTHSTGVCNYDQTLDLSFLDDYPDFFKSKRYNIYIACSKRTLSKVEVFIDKVGNAYIKKDIFGGIPAFERELGPDAMVDYKKSSLKEFKQAYSKALKILSGR